VVGFIWGLVSCNGFGVGGATISTNLGVTATALPDGSYLMNHPAGTFVFTASKEGHQPDVKTLFIGSGSFQNVPFNLRKN